MIDKKSKKILEEIRNMELLFSKDVEETAKEINLERRKKLKAEISIKYPELDQTETYINNFGFRTIVNKHIKNGSISECA